MNEVSGCMNSTFSTMESIEGKVPSKTDTRPKALKGASLLRNDRSNLPCNWNYLETTSGTNETSMFWPNGLYNTNAQ